MKTCPFCKSEIPADALKCKHCGEWVSAPPRQRSDDVLARAASRWVTFNIIWAIVVLTAILLLIFKVFLPRWNSFPIH